METSRKTSPMPVVSNTSPIIGRLGLLQTRFAQIRIPAAVKQELDRLSHAEASKAVQQGLADGWIRPQILRDQQRRTRTRSESRSR
jgi:predicted nucleic acid-binding protein